MHSYLWRYLLCGRIAGSKVGVCLALVNTASFSQWLYQPVRTLDVEPTEATMRTLSVGAGTEARDPKTVLKDTRCDVDECRPRLTGVSEQGRPSGPAGRNQATSALGRWRIRRRSWAESHGRKRKYWQECGSQVQNLIVGSTCWETQMYSFIQEWADSRKLSCSKSQEILVN